MSGLSLGTRTSNLKSVVLTVLNWSDWPVRCAQTDTHTQTHIELKQYLRHSLRSLGGDKNVSVLLAFYFTRNQGLIVAVGWLVGRVLAALLSSGWARRPNDRLCTRWWWQRSDNTEYNNTCSWVDHVDKLEDADGRNATVNEMRGG